MKIQIYIKIADWGKPNTRNKWMNNVRIIQSKSTGIEATWFPWISLWISH